MGKKRKRRRSHSRPWFQRNSKYLALVLIGAVAAGTVAFALNRPVAPSPSPTRTVVAAPAPTETQQPIRVAAVGDSITEANSPEFSAGRIGDGSWLPYTLGADVTFAGGWADGGSTTITMAENTVAYDADVLVIVAGTNDDDLPFEQTTANLDAIVAKAGVSRVIVSSIPPSNLEPSWPTAYNASLLALATERGWEFVDASAGLRTGEQYIDGYTVDGVHPTQEAARILGKAIRAAILG